jgi:autotransporter-associated beta strand protein
MIGTIDLGGAVRTITLNNTYDAIGATISNGGLIINGGAGTLNLYGRNTYSGDTTLNSGTTTPGPGGTFGNGTGTLNLNVSWLGVQVESEGLILRETLITVNPHFKAHEKRLAGVQGRQ